MSGNTSDSLTAQAGASPGLQPGARLGKYEIRRLLGAGGMGAVYEAHHTEIGKRVAIKVLAPELAAIPGAQMRFLREAQLASKINHPNIVNVNDVGNEDGRAFIVMEFLDGEDLSLRLERTGPLPVSQLIDIMLPVCSAVAEAHRVGITHRDLKPQNILLANGPRGVEPKVLDFGISKATDAQPGALTGTGMIGTPFYFAPEQILDARSAGPASDQYALGVILYECLTGRRPYEAESLFLVFQAIVDGNAPPVGRLRPDLPAVLQQIIARAMHKGPTGRFASASELGRALLPFASGHARSSWEHAFRDVGTAAPAPTLGVAPPPGTPRPVRAVAATSPMPRTPLPDRVAPGAGGIMLFSSTTAGGRAAPDLDGGADLDLRPRRRWGALLAFVVGVAAAVIAGFLAVGNRRFETTQSAAVRVAAPPAAVVEPPTPPEVPPPARAVAEPPAAPAVPEQSAPVEPRPKKIAAPAHRSPPAGRHRGHDSNEGAPILNPNAAPILD